MLANNLARIEDALRGVYQLSPGGIAVGTGIINTAPGFGGAGGYLEMHVYKPLIIYDLACSIILLIDGCRPSDGRL